MAIVGFVSFGGVVLSMSRDTVAVPPQQLLRIRRWLTAAITDPTIIKHKEIYPAIAPI